MTPKSYEAICKSIERLEYPTLKAPVYRALRILGRTADLRAIRGQNEIWGAAVHNIHCEAIGRTLAVDSTALLRMVRYYVSSIAALNRAIEHMGHMYYEDHNYPEGRVESCVQLYFELFISYKRLEDYLAEGETPWRRH